MRTYAAPVREMKFALTQLAGIREVATLPGYEDATPEIVDAVLEEAAKFAAGILDPLNRSGDREGARWRDGDVATPTAFTDAYRQFVAGGWNALPFPPEWGGQGLPKLVAAAVEEMWGSANLSSALCPMLSQGGATCRAIARLGGAEEGLWPEAGERRMDRHDESHRAAGQLESRPRAHARGTQGRPLSTSISPEWPMAISFARNRSGRTLGAIGCGTVPARPRTSACRRGRSCSDRRNRADRPPARARG
jgi:hypothetical protein